MEYAKNGESMGNVAAEALASVETIIRQADARLESGEPEEALNAYALAAKVRAEVFGPEDTSVIKLQYSMALACKYMGRFARAVSLLQEAEAALAKRGASYNRAMAVLRTERETVEGLMAGLGAKKESPAPAAGQQKMERAIRAGSQTELQDIAAEVERLCAASEKALAQGDSARAGKALHEALGVIAGKSVSGSLMARFYDEYGDYQEARGVSPEQCWKSALLLRSEQLRAESAMLGRTAKKLAQLYLREGNTQAAKDTCIQAMRAANQSGDAATAASLCIRLGSIFQREGNAKKALRYFNRAARISDARLGPNSTEAGNAYANMAAIHFENGHYEDALLCTLKVYRAQKKTDSASMDVTYGNLSRIFAALGYDGVAQVFSEKAGAARPSGAKQEA